LFPTQDWNRSGIELVLVGVIKAVVSTKGVIEERMEDCETIGGIITEEMWKKRTLQSVCIIVDAKDLVGHQV
jgi:hypothetical protein